MLIETMHREDVKACIRKRYGTLSAFHRAHDLPDLSVTKLLAGARTSQRVRAVIEAELQAAVDDEGHKPALKSDTDQKPVSNVMVNSQ